ncbi:MAG: recombinase zinc beta ribbon domain-containing protein, partial [Lachnospiraceae bacterium]|nr:recombinase zinc beta ribbon domain-containing protein [Lachnospiraceae bacterium]
PKEEWKVIPNHHEALITEEIYQQVASFRPEHSTKRKREKHPLIGVLYCGGCGYSLNYKPLTEKNKYRRFECRKHALLKIPECCTYMRADLLEEMILLMLNKELMLRGNATKQTKNLISFQKEGIQALKKRLDKCKQEKKQIQSEKDGLYEKYAFKQLSREEYQQKSRQMTEKLSMLSVKIEEVESKLYHLEMEHQKTEEDMKQIIKYSHIEELTQEVVDTFIEKVYVYKGKKVEIEWKFI